MTRRTNLLHPQPCSAAIGPDRAAQQPFAASTPAGEALRWPLTR